MNFNLNKNLDAASWDEFVQANSSDGGFLQSNGWGEFQAESGRKIWRLAVLADKKILAAALLVKHQLPFNQSYLYCPRGPVLINNYELIIKNDELLKFILAEIKKISRQEKSSFLRIDPAWSEAKILARNNFRFIGQVQPKKTLILDLKLGEAELLKQMKPKTRYNIKVSEKHQIKIKYSNNSDADFNRFWEMMVATAARDAIKAHPKGYYQKMLKTAGIKLALALDHNKAIAGAIIADFGAWRVYLHGASDYESREKMAPYGLQWQLISDAKKSGKKFYDFWGADEQKWPGVTRFKVGFAPKTELTEYVGAYDLAFKRVNYLLYSLLKKK